MLHADLKQVPEGGAVQLGQLHFIRARDGGGKGVQHTLSQERVWCRGGDNAQVCF